LWIAECDPEQQRAEALRPNITAPARADFEKAWQVFSARRTEADYRAWRDQRDWTAEKYRRFDRGEGMPPGLEAVGRTSTRNG
jgi:hypothetical protein